MIALGQDILCWGSCRLLWPSQNPLSPKSFSCVFQPQGYEGQINNTIFYIKIKTVRILLLSLMEQQRLDLPMYLKQTNPDQIIQVVDCRERDWRKHRMLMRRELHKKWELHGSENSGDLFRAPLKSSDNTDKCMNLRKLFEARDETTRKESQNNPENSHKARKSSVSSRQHGENLECMEHQIKYSEGCLVVEQSWCQNKNYSDST